MPNWAEHPAGHPGGAAEEGLIRADPDSGFEEFPAGLLLTVEDSIEADGRHTFSLQKYRSSLGAYCFYDCTARPGGGRLELCRGGGDDLLKGGTNF